MKVASIRLGNGVQYPPPQNIRLALQNVALTDPYILKDSDGLTASDRDVFISDVPGMGGYYGGYNDALRVITLTLKLNPNFALGQTAGDLRTGLYWMYNPSDDSNTLKLDLMDSAGVVPICTIPCYLAKLEPNPFTKDPEIKLTLPCGDKVFTGPIIYGNTSNGNATPPKSGTAYVFNNIGSDKVGFSLYFQLQNNTSTIRLQLLSSNKRFVISTPMHAGDYLSINTNPGSKGIFLNGTNLLPYLYTYGDDWLSFLPGLNNLLIIDDNGASVPTWQSWSFSPQYWGI